ncbi:hypothetical protein PHLGIDRAFT_486309 [Phlebiopsis gigantea 11061_1 CR5-6]|uniref:C2H2-type domain-containing protein n=1 Tax=Phlebiopsis gigantea (strain 11061_1 CR5-6) TaxID=745531 RepID=A0A0C3NLB3_PHLG1|nr:hypothetical protein PHLGIDRAFT_486309 [Phlebiopsis gigantea 11061_1 CR5-6]
MFLSSDKFECHVRDAHNHNLCTFCNVTFKPQETLECCQHIVRCHAGELSLAECVICRKEYRNMDVLSEHIKAVHRSRNSGVLHTANGVAKYCSVNGPFSSNFAAKSTKRMEGCTNRSSILPGEEVKTGERGGSPMPNNTGAPGSSTPISAVNNSVATPAAESEATADGSQDKSDATRTEDAARPEGSLATPGGWERSSSLVASDGNSGPEMNGVSEAGVLADFIRADGSGTNDNISVLELASGGQGNAADADPESDGDGRGRLSVSSVVGTDELADCANSVPSVLRMSDSETSKPEDEAPNTAPADRQEVSTAPPRL